MSVSNLLSRKTLGIIITDKRFIVSENETIIINCTACITRNSVTHKMIDAGSSITDINCVTKFPFFDGTITNFMEAEFMISTLLHKVSNWYNLAPKCNIAIPGITTETDHRVLIDAFNRKKCQTFYIPYIISKKLRLDNVTIIYLAERYTEIYTIRSSQITSCSHHLLGIEELYPLFSSLIDEIDNAEHFDVTFMDLVTRYFQQFYSILFNFYKKPSKSSEKYLINNELVNIAGHWFYTLLNNISSHKDDYGEYLVLMSDRNNIDFIGKTLTGILGTKVISINNSLKIIANHLSTI